MENLESQTLERIKEKLPRPYYLVDDSITVEVNDKVLGLEANAVFPSEDPDIVDRVNHVNMGSHLFAGWNAAAILCALAGYESPRATHAEISATKRTEPDEIVHLKATGEILEETEKLVRGKFLVVFTNQEGSILETVTSEFSALKRQEN